LGNQGLGGVEGISPALKFLRKITSYNFKHRQAQIFGRSQLGRVIN
jgi:hypothetical protein